MRALSKIDRRTIRAIDDAGWLDPDSDAEASGASSFADPSLSGDIVVAAHPEPTPLMSPIS
jgi:hypothetical protein